MVDGAIVRSIVVLLILHNYVFLFISIILSVNKTRTSSFLLCSIEKSYLWVPGKKRIILGKICIKGYGYCTSYIKGNPPKRYLRCCQLKKMGCKARAVQPLSSSEFFVLSEHNHPPDVNEKNVYDFSVELKKLCQSGINLRLKDIYEQVAECCPKGAALKPFEVVRCSMSRWRNSVVLSTGKPAD